MWSDSIVGKGKLIFQILSVMVDIYLDFLQ